MSPSPPDEHPESEWAWADVAKTAAPRTDYVDLVLDGAVAAELERARADLTAAKRSSDTLADEAVTELEGRVEELERAAQDSVRTFTVRSIGYRRWRELVEAHPSEDPNERWDPSAFIPAVLLECCDQFHTETDVDQALEVLTTGQVGKLFGKARIVNEGDDKVPSLRGR